MLPHQHHSQQKYQLLHVPRAFTSLSQPILSTRDNGSGISSFWDLEIFPSMKLFLQLKVSLLFPQARLNNNKINRSDSLSFLSF